jgi:hypothetical protein
MDMKFTNYFNQGNELVSFTRPQGSEFAKKVAGDFNPIHNVDAKRFCIPGDLLFSVVLYQYGVSQKMSFEFAGMVGDGIELLFPQHVSNEFSVSDANGKHYMDISRSGEVTTNKAFIENLIEKYVQFSGQAFPHVLIPLMQKEGVMINPARPIVIYKNMMIQLDDFNNGQVELKLTESTLQVNGKKGKVTLGFAILRDGNEIGHGTKNMVLSGLRSYEQEQVDSIITYYNGLKAAYNNAI